MEGRLLSQYRVLEKLGGGAMGVVYRGLDLRLDRHVALKFLAPELSRDTEARERLTQEAKAASALDHPNLCTIHDIDATSEGQLFIAMAYYDGETLKKRLAGGPMTLEDALDIAIQIAQGLAEAHAAGIVHRDIKPANVMLTKNKLVKIVDFGIAKLLDATGPTQAGTTMGTVAYMSPEQVACEGVDPQSDVWSLGAVLYELLTGQPPFNGHSEWAVMDAIRTREPQPPSSRRPGIPSSIDELVARALTKSKKDRFASAILGGAWNEPSHLYFEHDAHDPFSRLAGYGFRTVDYLGASAEQLAPLMRPIERVPRNYAAETPASDEVFSAYLTQFAYDPLPLNVSPIALDDTSEYWRKETVSFDAAYGGERITADLFIPKNVQPPFQTIVYFPGSGTTQQASSKERALANIDFVVKSSRAVLYPVYKDTFERRTGLLFTDPMPNRSYVEHVVWWVKDVKRSLDYLDTRSDIARGKVAFYGFSWGARLGSIVLAVDRRFHVAVLASGGFPLMQSLPEVKEINFAPRVTVPVLMVNGRHDRVFPMETSQKPMLKFLGTPADWKKHVVYDAGHVLVEARSQFTAEVLAWFDKHFGPVQ